MRPRRLDSHTSISRTAFLGGLAVALAGPGAVCLLAYVTNLEAKPGPTALFLIAVLLASWVGGVVPGLVAALASFVGLSYFFSTPQHGFHFDGESVFALASFLVAAVLVAAVLDRERRVLDRLRASSGTLGVALEVSRMGAWEWRPEAGLVWLSVEAERLLGLRAGEFDGTIESALDLVQPDDLDTARSAVESVLRGGTSIGVELRLVRRDGVARWIEVRGNEVPRTTPTVHRRLVGVLADVTDRQERTRQRERELADLTEEHGLLAAVIEQMPVGVIVAEATTGTILVDNSSGNRGRDNGAPAETVFDDFTTSPVFHPDGRPYEVDELPIVRSLSTGEVVTTESLEVLDEDGIRRAMEVSASPIHDNDGRVIAGVVTFTDVSQRDRLTRQRQFLSEASALLYSSLDYRETLARIAQLVVPSLADWCAIDLLEDGEIRNVVVHHVDPERADLARRFLHEHPPDAGAPTGVPAVIRTGRPELNLDAGDESFVLPHAAVGDRALVPTLAVRSTIVAPLRARSSTIGALMFVAEGARRYDESDLAFAEEVARRAALAVDNARLHEEQADALAEAEEARQRISRLQAVTEALSEAATRVEVANVLVREGLVALRAQAGAVFQLVAGGSEFESLASTGYPKQLHERWLRFDANAGGPASEALRTGHLIVTESPEELVERWPHLAAAQRATGDEATITAPLLVGDEHIGVMHIAFRKSRRFEPEDLGFVQTLARQCAQALERARLYEEELHAREQAERLASRLRRLQTVVDATFASGSLDELLERLLTRLRDAVESDTAAILILDEQEDMLVTRESVGFDEPVKSHVPVGQGFAGVIAATQRHLVVPDVSKIEVVGEQLRHAQLASLAGVPLVTEGRTIGVVHVGMRTPREFDREDLLLLRLVAARVAVAIDRAQVHEREHRIAEILQRSLLPERLPAIDGLEAAARYVPGTVGVAVGGDWYDVFELPDGSIGVAVGDVVGHGVRAAASMGRLRNVLRAYAVEGFGPAEALTRLNRLACDSGDDVFATVVFALVAPSRSRLRLASAGHPPPLLRCPDGSVQLIDEGRSLPIGATPDAVYADAELQLAPGSSLVLYTDGLVERRGESIDVGIARLAGIVERSTAPVDELADLVVEELESADHTDDVALVAVRLEPVGTPQLSLRFPSDAEALAPMRGKLAAWLESHGADHDEVFEILVAVNEACSNAVEHPIGGGDQEIGLDAELIDGEVSIEVRDHGRWRPPEPRSDRGRGFDFMRTLMETVDVARSPDGTHVRLRRRLRQR